MQKTLLLLLFFSLSVICFGQSNKKPKDTRHKLKLKDEVYVCYIKDKSIKYIQSGKVHYLVDCVELAKCRGQIEKLIYNNTLRNKKSRPCEVCCRK